MVARVLNFRRFSESPQKMFHCFHSRNLHEHCSSKWSICLLNRGGYEKVVFLQEIGKKLYQLFFLQKITSET